MRELWRYADALQHRYNTHIIVGSKLGLPWFDEIVAYESTVAAELRPAKPRVTWLAPPGSVRP